MEFEMSLNDLNLLTV